MIDYSTAWTVHFAQHGKIEKEHGSCEMVAKDALDAVQKTLDELGQVSAGRTVANITLSVSISAYQIKQEELHEDK